MPALSLVKIPAVLTFTPSANLVNALPNVKLLPAAVILALILVSDIPPTAPPSTTLPPDAKFKSSSTVSLATLLKVILLKLLTKSALMTD